ncbi:MAG: hypothetical protein P1U46_00370 [Patescibacteria group bacterium]|nr:hypothetical protein [Patescibacteria group bacterium]
MKLFFKFFNFSKSICGFFFSKEKLVPQPHLSFTSSLENIYLTFSFQV